MTYKSKIDPRKVRLIEYLITPKKYRTLNKKDFAQQELRISEQTLYNWISVIEEEGYLEDTQSQIMMMFDIRKTDIVHAMINKALKGNISAAKFVFEYFGW